MKILQIALPLFVLFCLDSLRAQVINDECVNAVHLFVNPGSACDSVTQSSLVDATLSPEPITCSTLAYDDVWFKFTATNTRQAISIDPTTENPLDYYFAVYAGNCGSLGSPLICCTDNYTALNNLQIGVDYYIRVFSQNAIPNGMISFFTICVSETMTPPSNDECQNAITVPVNPDLNCTDFVSGTLANALQSTEYSACQNGADDDVWYRFTATQASHQIKFFAVSGSNTYLKYSVLDGDCTNFNASLLCSTQATDTVSNLVPGKVYYIRVYSYGSSNAATSFNLCIGSILNLYDECNNALELAVNVDNSCSSGNSISVYNQTVSADPMGCSATNVGDAWYKFTATSSSHIIDIQPEYNYLRYTVYRGSCAALSGTSICNYFESSYLDSLSVGETIYIRLFKKAVVDRYAMANICIRTPKNFPANDHYTNAINLSVNPDENCNLSSTANFTDARPSNHILSLPTTDLKLVNIYSMEDDIWFKFTATQAFHAVVLSDILNNSSGINIFCYSNINLASTYQTPFAFALNNDTLLLRNVIVGNTYYIRLSTGAYLSGENASLKICINSPALPPNDECVNSIELQANSLGNECALSVNSSLLNATHSSPTSTCSTGDDDDVWFHFTATATSHVVHVYRLSDPNARYAITGYSGSCGTLTEIACSKFNQNSLPIESYLNLANLTIGQVYYVKVYSSSSDNPFLSSPFQICLNSCPANDLSQNSEVLVVNPSTACNSVTTGKINLATPSYNNCTASETIDVWYSFTATSTSHTITLNGNSSLRFRLGTYCSNSAVISNLVIGTSYSIQVYLPTLNNLSDFTICISTPPAVPVNDNCSSAINVPVNPGMICDSLTNASFLGASVSSVVTSNCNAGSPDIWFKFTATSTQHQIQVLNNVNCTAAIPRAVYNSSCGSGGLALFCYTDNQEVLTGLSVGQTYYVRFFHSNVSDANFANFDICIKSVPPPINNQYTTATVIPINETNVCDTSIVSNLQFSTSTLPNSPCTFNSNPVVGDVWFTFVATHQRHQLTINSLTAGIDNQYLKITLYDASRVFLRCIPFGSQGLNNLTIGATYYVEVANYFYPSYKDISLFVCLTSDLPSPNDNCENAVDVSNLSTMVNSCRDYPYAAILNATPSPQSNDCSNTSDNDDIWFKFKAVSPKQRLSVKPDAGYISPVFTAVYSGSCPNFDSTLVCAFTNDTLLTNLIVGNTYYFRVYTQSNTEVFTPIDITLCSYFDPPACSNNLPAGNTCAEALEICKLDGYCGQTSASYTADSWPAFDTTFCGTIENNSFLSFYPNSSTLSFRVWVTSSLINLGIQIFVFEADSCNGAVTNHLCWDPNFVPVGPTYLQATNLVPGKKYYMMIDGQSGDVCDYIFDSYTELTPPVSFSASNANICLGDSVLLTVSGGNGSYTWPSVPGLEVTGTNTAIFKPTQTGLNSFKVSSFVSDFTCASASTSEYEIDVRGCFCPVQVTHNSDLCVDHSFDLQASEVFNAIYEWTGPDGFSSNLQNPSGVSIPKAVGSYDYILKVTSATTTCYDTARVNIASIPDARFSYSQNAYCNNAAIEIPSINSAGSFSSTAGLTLNSITGEIDFSTSLPNSYAITHTTGGFCSQSFTDTIVIHPTPGATQLSDKFICPGDSFPEIVLSGSNASSFDWFNDNTQTGVPASGTNALPAAVPLDDSLEALITVIPHSDFCVGDTMHFKVGVYDNIITFDTFPQICMGSMIFYNLSEGNPDGGGYSGPFISGASFYPAQSGPGTFVIYYEIVAPGNLCVNRDSTYITVETCVSVDEFANAKSLLIYPNPAFNELHISYPGHLDISLFDTNGKLLLQQEGLNQMSLNISDFAEGIYYLKLKSGSINHVEKISIIR